MQIVRQLIRKPGQEVRYHQVGRSLFSPSSSHIRSCGTVAS